MSIEKSQLVFDTSYEKYVVIYKMENIQKYVITINDDRYNGFNDRIPWYVNKYNGVRKKNIGCGLSHLNLWKEAGKLHDVFLVFEDDAMLCRDFTQQDEESVQKFLDDDDRYILFLGYNTDVSYYTGHRSSNIVDGYGLDLHAYIIKTPYAKYLEERYGKMVRTNIFHWWGAIDTIFLMEPISMLTPILFIQYGDPRYDNIEKFTMSNKPKNITRILTTINYAFFYRKMILLFIFFVVVVVVVTALCLRKKR